MTVVNFDFAVRGKRSPRLVSPAAVARANARARIPGKRVLGFTRVRFGYYDPQLSWSVARTADPKWIMMSLVQVNCAAELMLDIQIAANIARGSPCFAHVLAHERQHFDIWRRGMSGRKARIGADIRKRLLTYFRSPRRVPAADETIIRSDYQGIVWQIAKDTVEAHARKVRIASLKIHTPAELAETNRICAAHLAP
ncbi:hypothetical protein LNKW23_10170 [Paralimibaculum aggregatum]|uniref:Uncharacterized protein n=1 Tax=Paralimibaculum aggregatum TaxID=3036245 RepID=A0ABQ6LI38_9RHOB|nr:hypothetical protein [Limibaculum sp. NKW23]GMG81804.1 hypothetical protein LNKW23_10170 [Limibaculum sp. NKW23]